jgi:hypothetical protein
VPTGWVPTDWEPTDWEPTGWELTDLAQIGSAQTEGWGQRSSYSREQSVTLGQEIPDLARFDQATSDWEQTGLEQSGDWGPKLSYRMALSDLERIDSARTGLEQFVDWSQTSSCRTDQSGSAQTGWELTGSGRRTG